MSVWSKLPILSAETRHLVSNRRASLWVTLETASGKVVNFVGVHPTPPGLIDGETGDTRRDSRVRDAELLLVADEIANRKSEAWTLAGEFNDVAWSHTTRLFKRTSGLLDPRIGRSFMGTYIAQYPPFRCPIDHVFLSNGSKFGRCHANELRVQIILLSSHPFRCRRRKRALSLNLRVTTKQTRKTS